jgi:hypothetical protein
MEVGVYEGLLHLLFAIKEKTNNRKDEYIIDENKHVSPVIFDFN